MAEKDLGRATQSLEKNVPRGLKGFTWPLENGFLCGYSDCRWWNTK